MFSKSESKILRQKFWTSFGQEYPRKWILYHTKIKEIQFKFTFSRKFAQISLDIDSDDEIIQAYYFEKIQSLQKILKSEYLPHITLLENYELPEGKSISRAFVELNGVSINNEKDWPLVKKYLAENMLQFELFWFEFKDFIKN
ncbi:DUF4268 domain-containing protein [Zunongwangia sp. HRR-M8]|uniref:DUF4268 domain-containing protein n=1 Tax=Zunongwangia sp. HRR-M8 TaxID=3015170 RepID=UPI0022DE2A7A|nr:DUF4268 domain-containing protein [Zunongwangia sp. HRR-M8]WBL23565.1 DUF4268 domain-containing protein [Zunongwangia sp. HRR-M8]